MKGVSLAVMALVGLAALGPDAGQARAQGCSYIVEGTTWLYQPEAGAPSDWADPKAVDSPDASSWLLGCAPFSSGGCGFAPGTYWDALTTLVLRQHVWLVGGETGLVASIGIDNDFDLWVNGSLVGSLVHEGCATRWDAVIPVPDALWVVGDNVVAVRIIDRGGITNFEMTLTGPDTGACPPGCAQLACGTPGPVPVLPDVAGCGGSTVIETATASWTEGCPSDFVYRFRGSDGSVLRPWDVDPSMLVQVGGDGAVTVDIRCAYSPTCPVGTATAAVTQTGTPPADPGPRLRVTRPSGLAVLDWSRAPPLLPGEHFHVVQSDVPDAAFVRVNAEADVSTTWVDPKPYGLAFYLVRVADACETESADVP